MPISDCQNSDKFSKGQGVGMDRSRNVFIFFKQGRLVCGYAELR